MRTAPSTWIGYVAISLSALITVVPASLARDSLVFDQGKSAGTGIAAEERPRHDELSDGLRLETPEHTGVFVAVPTGKVWVGPELVDGQPSYVRRTKGKEGMLIVEVSTTPFMDELPGFEGSIPRPEALPASW